MRITGTHIAYYLICKRKLWFYIHEIEMESTSDIVYEGKVLHEQSYSQRSDRYKEIEIEGIKIDFYDHKNHTIHEIKKSDKMQESHKWQLRYYMYVLRNMGIQNVKGVLEYPLLHTKLDVILTTEDNKKINEMIDSIEKMKEEACPNAIYKAFCDRCSFYDFCFITETD